MEHGSNLKYWKNRISKDVGFVIRLYPLNPPFPRSIAFDFTCLLTALLVQDKILSNCAEL
jgi:hypothetical protein